MDLTESDALSAYSTALNTLSVAPLAPLLADDFVYESQTVFESINSKAAFLDYLTAKLATIQETGALVFAEMGTVIAFGIRRPCVVLAQNSPSNLVGVVLARIEDDKITRLDLCVVPSPSEAVRSGDYPGRPPPHEFVSYATEYDLYKGERSIGDLEVAAQDTLLKEIFDPKRNYRDFAVHHNVRKAQVEGLWSLIVFVGLELERSRRITNFEERTDTDIEEIISFFSDTLLWLRLEEAFSPFNVSTRRTDYPWEELEGIRIELLTEATGAPLTDVKDEICKHLAKIPISQPSEPILRMPYHAFKVLYESGKLVFYVDRGLALNAARAGLIQNPVSSICALAFNLSVVAFIPVGIFVNWTVGLTLLLAAYLFKKLATELLIKTIRKEALASKDMYRILLAHQVIWFRLAR